MNNLKQVSKTMRCVSFLLNKIRQKIQMIMCEFILYLSKTVDLNTMIQRYNQIFF